MKTNFQMIREIKDYAPKSSMFTSKEEIEMLNQHFGLDKMSLLELRNLRDMVVLVYDKWLDDAMDEFPEQRKLMSAMQSITAVIDHFKLNAGAKVEEL